MSNPDPRAEVTLYYTDVVNAALEPVVGMWCDDLVRVWRDGVFYQNSRPVLVIYPAVAPDWSVIVTRVPSETHGTELSLPLPIFVDADRAVEIAERVVAVVKRVLHLGSPPE